MGGSISEEEGHEMGTIITLWFDLEQWNKQSWIFLVQKIVEYIAVVKSCILRGDKIKVIVT